MSLLCWRRGPSAWKSVLCYAGRPGSRQIEEKHTAGDRDIMIAVISSFSLGTVVNGSFIHYGSFIHLAFARSFPCLFPWKKIHTIATMYSYPLVVLLCFIPSNSYRSKFICIENSQLHKFFIHYIADDGCIFHSSTKRAEPNERYNIIHDFFIP